MTDNTEQNDAPFCALNHPMHPGFHEVFATARRQNAPIMSPKGGTLAHNKMQTAECATTYDRPCRQAQNKIQKSPSPSTICRQLSMHRANKTLADHVTFGTARSARKSGDT